jgi:hypothetical protein
MRNTDESHLQRAHCSGGRLCVDRRAVSWVAAVHKGLSPLVTADVRRQQRRAPGCSRGDVRGRGTGLPSLVSLSPLAQALDDLATDWNCGSPSSYGEPTAHSLHRTHTHASLARQVHFFDRYGEELQERTIFLERLKVRKRWYKGLADDHVDHRMPDIRDTFEGELLQEEEPGQVSERRGLAPHSRPAVSMDPLTAGSV